MSLYKVTFELKELKVSYLYVWICFMHKQSDSRHIWPERNSYDLL